MNMPRSRLIFTIFLLGLIVPIQMTLVPLTILYQRNLDLIDQPAGPVLPLSRLRPAARNPGAARLLPRDPGETGGGGVDRRLHLVRGMYWRIVMPLAKPAVVSLLILDGVATWNEFILAQIFIRTKTNRTLPLGVVQFRPNSPPPTNCSRRRS